VGRTEVGIDTHRQFPRSATPGQHTRNTVDGGQPRSHALIDKIEQTVAIFETDDLDEHGKAADPRQILRIHLDARTPRLLADELGGHASEVELAHLEVGTVLELHGQAPARTADLGPGLFHSVELGHTGLDGHQDLALDHLGLAPRSIEADVEILTGDRGNQLDGDAGPGDPAHGEEGQKEHRRGDGTANGKAERVHDACFRRGRRRSSNR